MLTVLTQPPTITSQPTNQTVSVGGTAGFGVAVTGSAPFTYQWSFNGTNLSSATNISLTLPNAQLTNAGMYSVTVTNLYGSVTSSNAVLTVLLAPPCNPAPSGLVGWWPAEGNANDIDGTNNGTLISGVTFASGEVGQAFNVSGSDYVSVPDAPALDPTNAITVECWFYRRAVVGSFDPVVKKAGTPLVTDNSGYTLEFNGNNILFWIYSSNVGWQSSGGAVPIQLGQWYHAAGVFDGAHLMVYINGQLAASSSTSGRIVPSVSVLCFGRDFNEGRYFNGLIDEVSIYNRALSSNEIAAIYSTGSGGKCPLPPIILTQPTNQTVSVGGTATFSVSANGTPSLFYQWSFNGTNISGATTTMLTLSNIQPIQAGTYVVQVANTGGSTNSAGAVLTVNTPPGITTQPAGCTNVAGTTASFIVVASGSTPLTYQWKKNGANIAGATSTNFTIGTVLTKDAATYSVAITNAYGSILSSNAMLVVNPLLNFVWNQIPSPRFANAPFTVVIQAQFPTNGLIANFTNTVVLTVHQWRAAQSGGFRQFCSRRLDRAANC